MSDCRDWTRIANPGQSVGWRCNTHGDGPYVGDSSPFFCRVGRAEETERILQDLIAELKDAVTDYPPTVFKEFTDDDPASQSRTVDRIAGVAMRHAWTRAGEMADRAEARLREVQG